jgi:WbqC-like protein family
MNPGKCLLSSAYFPPINYFSLIMAADRVLIENEENYIKQSYRNRCRIYAANGPMTLSVPVLAGSFRKTPLKETRIDYSKRWQQVHLGAIESAYRSSPYFEFYFDDIKDVISAGHELLIDLNLQTIIIALKISGITTPCSYTEAFEEPAGKPYDFRYLLSPKKPDRLSRFSFASYFQTFSDRHGFVPGLSILDLIFNMGPDSSDLIRRTTLNY